MSQSQALAVVNTQEMTEMFHGTELAPLWRNARFYASTTLVAKGLRGRPAEIMGIMLACIEDDMPPNPLSIKKYWIGPDGTPERTAQLTIDLAAQRGYETKWGTVNDDVAELSIRRYGGGEWQTFSFTIEQARNAHWLDEWVEHWRRDENRNFLEKWVFNCQAEHKCKASLIPKPAWAEAEIAKGNVNHKDSWFNTPADMLCARVAVRAVKRGAPGVLGFHDNIQPVPGDRQRVVLSEPAQDEDDDITDAEVVADLALVPVLEAKRQLLDACEAQGLSLEAAKAEASRIWAEGHVAGPVHPAFLAKMLEEAAKLGEPFEEASAAAGDGPGEGAAPVAAGEPEQGEMFGGEE